MGRFKLYSQHIYVHCLSLNQGGNMILKDSVEKIFFSSNTCRIVDTNIQKYTTFLENPSFICESAKFREALLTLHNVSTLVCILKLL